MEPLDDRIGEFFLFPQVDDRDAQVIDEVDQLLVHALVFDDRGENIGDGLQQLCGCGGMTMVVIAVDNHHARWCPVLDDRDTVVTSGGLESAPRHGQWWRGGKKPGFAVPCRLAAVAEPETNLPAGQALLLAETPGGCQQKELGIRFDEKYGCLAVELEFSEGDEIIEDVPELVLQLGRLERYFQDIINDFLVF